MVYCQEENEKQETKNAEGHCQRNLGFHTTSAAPPCHAELRQQLKENEPLPRIEYIYSK